MVVLRKTYGHQHGVVLNLTCFLPLSGWTRIAHASLRTANRLGPSEIHDLLGGNSREGRPGPHHHHHRRRLTLAATAASASPTSGADAKPPTAVVDLQCFLGLWRKIGSRMPVLRLAKQHTQYPARTRCAGLINSGLGEKISHDPGEAFAARGNPVVRNFRVAPRCCCSMSRCQSHCRQDGYAERKIAQNAGHDVNLSIRRPGSACVWLIASAHRRRITAYHGRHSTLKRPCPRDDNSTPGSTATRN